MRVAARVLKGSAGFGKGLVVALNGIAPPKGRLFPTWKPSYHDVSLDGLVLVVALAPSPLGRPLVGVSTPVRSHEAWYLSSSLAAWVLSCKRRLDRSDSGNLSIHTGLGINEVNGKTDRAGQE